MDKFLIIIAISIIIAAPASAQDYCDVESTTWQIAESDIRQIADRAFANLMVDGTYLMPSIKRDAASISILLLNFDGVVQCEETQRRIDAYHEFAYWMLLVSSLISQPDMGYLAASVDEYNLIDSMADRTIEAYNNLDSPSFNFGQRS